MIVVTGASGLLGSCSLKFLKRIYKKELIIGTYYKNKSTDKSVILIPYSLDRSSEFVENLNYSEDLYFVHFASTVSFDFNTNYRNDIYGIRSLIDSLPKKYNHVRFIYISSTSVDKLDSDYSVTKKFIEDLLIKAASNSFSVRILRVPYVNKNSLVKLVKAGFKESIMNISENHKVIRLG